MNKKISFLLVLALTIVVIGTEVVRVTATERTTLKFIFAGKEGRFSYVIEAFEKENPGVKINTTYLPFKEVHAQYIILASANKLPDGGQIFDNMVAEF